MQTEDKYCNIYDLDLSASTDTFIRKLADINIFITGWSLSALLELLSDSIH